MLPNLTGASGAAFPLRWPAEGTQSIQIAGGDVHLRAGAPYVTITTTAPIAADEVRSHTWRLLQEAFDLHAAKTRSPFATDSGERDFLTWTRNHTGYDVTYVEAAHAGWSISGTIVGGGPAPPPPPPPAHHPALRFYRLSQVSDDLFDAYRNAYLAFECLISGESNKTKDESELDWLKRVSKNQFAAAIPGGLNIDDTLTAVYRVGRLPLFHAKQNSSFFTPQGSERENVLTLLEDLTFLLVSFLKHKLGNHAVAGWGSMSQAVYDAQARIMFDCDAVVIRGQFLRRTVQPVIQVYDSPRHFGNLWGHISFAVPHWFKTLKSIETKFAGEPRLKFSPLELVPLLGVSRFTIELNNIGRHARSPKRLHRA